MAQKNKIKVYPFSENENDNIMKIIADNSKIQDVKTLLWCLRQAHLICQNQPAEFPLVAEYLLNQFYR